MTIFTFFILIVSDVYDKNTNTDQITIDPNMDVNTIQTNGNKSSDMVNTKIDNHQADNGDDNISERRGSLPLSAIEFQSIDLKVIEPYKKVISHGGHLRISSNGEAVSSEFSSSAIILFSACYLPDRSRPDYHYVMDNLFL